MSRSYKKYPHCGDSGGKKNKKIANRLVRRALNRNPDCSLENKSYKKHFESWNISDFSCSETFEQYWEDCVHFHEWCLMMGYEDKLPSKKEAYKNWYKTYKMK